MKIKEEELKTVIRRVTMLGYQGIHLIEYALAQEGHLRELCINGLLLSPDFASAYWPGKERTMTAEYHDMKRRAGGWSASIHEWEYHIQQASTSGDVIGYFYHNI